MIMGAESFAYWLVKYLNCVFEVFLLYYFLEDIFPVFEDRKRMVVLEAAVCVTMILCVNLAEVPHVNLIGVPLIFILFVYLVFRIKIKTAVSYSLFYFIIWAITEFVFWHVCEGIGIGQTMEGFSWMLRLFMEKIVVFMIIQIVRKIHQDSTIEESYPVLVSLFILPASAITLLNGFLLSDSSPYGYLFVCVGGVTLIFSNIVNFWVIEKLLAAEGMVRDNKMLALKTELERNHYHRLEEINQEYAKYMHEMRHIAKTMDQLLESEGGEELRRLALEAGALLKKDKLSQKRVYCTDPILNAVFMEREKMAGESKVAYEVDIQPGLCLDFINETDKIRIFGNLLDNALEAAGGCGNGRGYVKAKLYMGNEAMVVFRLVNNFVHENKRAVRWFQTTKPDKKAHGFGLQNVEELAGKYHGFFGVTEEEDEFVVMLVLSNAQKINLE